jgi:Cu/Ag efflux protein CusF
MIRGRSMSNFAGNFTIKFSALLAVFVMTLCACAHKSETSNLPIKQYELHGQVVRLDPQTHAATIKGQKIEGWMGAMTMEYPVKDASDYQRLGPGENITASVFVQGLNFWIANVRPEPPASK